MCNDLPVPPKIQIVKTPLHNYTRQEQGDVVEGSYSRVKDVRRRSVTEERPAVSQGCQIDRSTLKNSNLASVNASYWKIAVGQGVKGPSPDIFGY